MRKLTLLLIGTFLFCWSALAGELRTTVKYVAQDAVYLDAGRGQGIVVGDRGTVWRGDKQIAELEIVFVADRSASCRVIGNLGAIAIGDAVRVNVTEVMSSSPPSGSVSPPPATGESPRPRGKRIRSNLIRGRIGAQWIAYDDLEQADGDYSQPSLVVNTSVNNLGGSHYSLAVDLRARRTNRNRESFTGAGSTWNSRVYTVALQYDDPASRLSYQAGRFVESRLSGTGYLDGLWANYRWRKDLKFGVFGGLEPEPVNSKVRTDVAKVGLGAQYERQLRGRARVIASAALSGIYDHGHTHREILFQQCGYSDNHWVVFESASVNFNRGDLRDAEGSVATLTDVNLNANWRPSHRLTLSAGYDNHRNYRIDEPESLADSLFDDAVRQGLRGSVTVRPLADFYASLLGTLRSRRSDFTHGRTVSASVGMTRVGQTPLSWDARWTSYENEYSSGSQPSMSLRARLHSSWDATLSLGSDRYEISRESITSTATWTELATTFRIARHYYGSLSSELRRGDFTDGNRYVVEFGYRF